MILRFRVIIIVVLTITALAGTIFVVFYRVIFPSFSSIEQQQMMQDLQTGANAFQNELEEINNTGRDWACWDDTYAFVKDHNQAYIRNNLKPPDLKTILVNLVVILDQDNHIVFSRAIDFENTEEIQIPRDVPDFLIKNAPNFTAMDAISGFSGVVVLEEHLMLMSAWPIFDSNQVMPRRGTLIFGRYIDALQIEALARGTSIPFKLIRFDDPDLEQNTRLVFKEMLLHDIHRIIQTPFDNQIIGYAGINDIDGQPTMALRIISTRPLHRQAQAMLYYFLAVLIVLGIIFGLATYLFINRAVVSRIERLSLEVNQIGDQQDFQQRVTVNGSDEVAHLASQTNNMLTRLQTAQVQLQDRNRSLEICNKIITQMALAGNSNALLEDALKGILAELDYYAGVVLDVDHTDRRLTTVCEVNLTDAMKTEIGAISFESKSVQDILWYAKPMWMDERAESGALKPLDIAAYLPLIIHDNVEAILVLYHSPTQSKDHLRKETLMTILRELSIELDRIQSDMRIKQLNKELTLTMQAKDNFLATVSHELQTPLNAILGLSETLQDGVFGALSESQTESIMTIHESVRNMMALITNVLDLSRIQAGRLTLQRDWTIVKNLCELSVRMVEAQARSKDIKISYSVDDPEQAIWVDQRRIRQTLIILLNNAVKYTPQGGEVKLKVHSEPHSDRTQFIVHDTGIGVEVEKQPDLFKPFTQVNGGGLHNQLGSGLGLALADGLVRLHGGEITLESSIDQGSSFTISLPGYPGEGMAAPDE